MKKDLDIFKIQICLNFSCFIANRKNINIFVSLCQSYFFSLYF